MAAALRQVLAGTIDVERQHRHRRLERRALATPASQSGALQRPSDVLRPALIEYAVFQIQRVAVARHVRRPEPGLAARPPVRGRWRTFLGSFFHHYRRFTIEPRLANTELLDLDNSMRGARFLEPRRRGTC